jgi:hypothetical protein
VPYLSLSPVTTMKLPYTLLVAVALASGCASSALDDNVQNNAVEALLVPRSAMTVEIPFYTTVSS